MIKLEKNFIGEVCETCRMLHPCVYKILDNEKNIIINVGCLHHDICCNTLLQDQKIRLKEKEND